MKQTFSLITKQTLNMTQQIQQAIKLLLLSSAELDLEIQTALEANVMLEPSSDLDLRPVYGHSALDNNNYENFSNAEDTLQEYLYWQLNLAHISAKDKIIAINIIDSINDNGYLIATLEEIQVNLQNNHPDEFKKLDITEIEAVLHKVQQFDPVGIGSRNLRECLLLQLGSLPASNRHVVICKQLVTNYLDLLGEKKYSKISKNMHLSKKELQTVIQTLTKLQPYPGNILSNQIDEHIIPEITVNKKNNKWVVGFNNNLATNIRINPSYAALIKRADSSRDNKFMREQLTEAKWFLNSIKTRNETLLKVATSIVKQQQDFFEHGEEHMQPMTLQNIAESVNLSESSISRITTKKYMHTPHGTYELKFFFSSYVSNINGDYCSSTAIKAIIKKLIGKEDAEHRLSDQKITDEIFKCGIRISRRTVTKYRESLKIKSSNQR